MSQTIVVRAGTQIYLKHVYLRASEAPYRAVESCVMAKSFDVARIAMKPVRVGQLAARARPSLFCAIKKLIHSLEIDAAGQLRLRIVTIYSQKWYFYKMETGFFRIWRYLAFC
jgi:hypothetical protein